MKYDETMTAIQTHNKDALLAYAVQADAAGWACAAREMRLEATKITLPIAFPTPTPAANPDGTIPSVLVTQNEIDAMPADLKSRVTLALNTALGGGNSAESTCHLWSEVVDLKLYPKTAERLRVKCNELASLTPAKSDKQLSIEELPLSVRSEVNTALDTYPHTVYGWQHGAAPTWTKLKTLGYDAAAFEYIKIFLPVSDTTEDTPGNPGLGWAQGGA